MHQLGDGSTVATLGEREAENYSTENLTEDGFWKDNHYIKQHNHCERRIMHGWIPNTSLREFYNQISKKNKAWKWIYKKNMLHIKHRDESQI